MPVLPTPRRIALLAAAFLAPALALADGPATAPAARNINQIMADLQAVAQDASTYMSPMNITDASRRAQNKDAAIAALRKFNPLLDELRAAPAAPNTPAGLEVANQIAPRIVILQLVYGDDQAQAATQKLADSKADGALTAKGELLFSRWIVASGNNAEQSKIADDAVAFAQQNKNSDAIAGMLSEMAEVGQPPKALSDKLQSAVTDQMTCSTAKQLKTQLVGERKLASMENNPLAFTGLTNENSKFNSADWKGKVVLVDFWATWCGPCKEELPRVKKIYAQYHPQGLEIVGVSCDRNVDDLNKFLHENPDMPWPQIFDPKQTNWSPLAESYGIEAIPTMFLIDRKGVLRTVDARENMEKLIPQLLAESDK